MGAHVAGGLVMARTRSWGSGRDSACLRRLASRATAQSLQIFSAARRMRITARGQCQLALDGPDGMRLISLMVIKWVVVGT